MRDVPNRLASAASTYLRMHADDPVDWFPWGEEAFARARELDRPVFLSSGYAACHWCHVMQAESFRDPDTAALLNERFVAVKVDRQLRPDVDALYIDYVAATTGSGGWPLSVFLTPDRIPVLGGTYFPKQPHGGIPSFTAVLEGVADAYRDDRARLRDTEARSLVFLREQSAPKPRGPLDRAMLDLAADQLVKMSDMMFGGFGRGPKFPQLPAIEFLCAYQALEPDPEVALAIELTLLGIVRGGIFDQVGGGVHRYAVDEEWRVPHFEKMLTDQGLLLSALAQASPHASSDAVRAEYAWAAARTESFLRREMAAPGGGFIAALSADTAGEEGATYTWTHDQLAAALSPEGLALAETRLGAETAGSSRAVTLARAGADGDPSDLDGVLLELLAARQARPQPEADPSVVTSWNAMAARGLMEAGEAFGLPRMTALGVDTALAAQRAWLADGVVREPTDPSVAGVRLLEDAAHLTAALVSAARAGESEALLDRALDLHVETTERFVRDDVAYMTPATSDLPVRPLENGDGATPSGATTLAENALRLGLATGDASLLAQARAALGTFWGVADFAPDRAGRALAVAARLELASRG